MKGEKENSWGERGEEKRDGVTVCEIMD